MAEQRRAMITVAVPLEARAAYAATLALLEIYDSGLFTHASAHVVTAMLAAAEGTCQPMTSGSSSPRERCSHGE